jgi:hypothetical protein
MNNVFISSDVQQLMSKAIHISQSCGPNIQYSIKSLATANVITRDPTNRSANAFRNSY